MRRIPGADSFDFALRVLGVYCGSRLVVLAGFYFAALLISLGMPGLDPKPHVRQLNERHAWRWLSGDAELSLPPLPAAGADTLVIEGYAVSPDLEIVVTIADTAIDTLRVAQQPREYHLALPARSGMSDPGAGTHLKVALRSADFSPRELSAGTLPDERRLAFCLQGLRYGVARATELSIEGPGLVVRGGYGPEGRAEKLAFPEFFMSAVSQWDAGWYLDIARHGYRFSASELGHYQPTAFFPLYPLVSRTVAEITGASIEATMLVLANLFAAAGMVIFGLLLRRAFSADIAWAAVLLLSFFPLSLYLSLPYTEPFLLLLMAITLAMLQRDRIVAAAVICGISTACRPTAIALAPAILWQHFRPGGRWETPGARRLMGGVGLGLLSCAGIIAYATYLGVRFDAPFAFSQAQTGWARNVVHSPLEMISLSWVLRQIWWTLVHDPLALLVDPRAWGYWSLPAALVLLLVNWRRFPFSWTLAGLVMLLIPYVFYGRTDFGLASMARYVALDLPVFASLAILVSGPDRKALLGALVGVFGAMLLIASVLFAAGNYFVG